MSDKINTIYLGYACCPPFVIQGTLTLTLKEPLTVEEAQLKAEKTKFTVEDFYENYEESLFGLPASSKYIFFLDQYEAQQWALNEALYGE